MRLTREKSSLALLHGFSQNKRIFSRQQEYFASEYEVSLLELRGHGENPNDQGPFGFREYADDVLRQLKSKGVTRTHFWGTHTGAAVGILLALEHPLMISTLVLEAPVIPGHSMPIVNSQFETAKAMARQLGIRSAVEHWFATAPWFDTMRRLPSRCRAEEHKSIVLEFRGAPLVDHNSPAAVPNVMGDLWKIHHPCLIYNGGDDHPDFLNSATLIAERAPDSQRKVFETLGGFPSWEDPDSVNPVVQAFLRKHSGNPVLSAVI